MTDGNYTCGKLPVMYITVESLGCTPETNIISYIHYISVKKLGEKLSKKKKPKEWYLGS